MQEITGEFRSNDGLKLFECRWLPEAPARAAILIVHGYSEHSGRRHDMARPLLEAGCAIHMFDLRGHGRSEGPRAFVRSFSEYVGDLQRFFERTRERSQTQPLFLLGHSMGGLIAAKWAIDRQESLQGLILSAAALKINEQVHPWLRRVAGVVAAVAPRLPSIKLNPEAVSRNPAAVQAYRNDPLVYHGRMPARTGAELLRNARELAARSAEFELPLLLMHGSADRLTDPAGSQRLHELAASPDKTLLLYPGLYHELSQEPERDQVLADLVGWVQARS